MLETFCLRSTSNQPALRIGLLLDSYIQPAWIVQILEHIRASDFARIEFIILNEAAQKPFGSGGRVPLPVRAIRVLRDPLKRKRLLYSWYLKWDQKTFKPSNDPFRRVDCTELLSGFDRIAVRPVTKGFTHRFTPEDLKLVQGRNLDVMLRFGFNILRGDILKAARYGVWSYHHGDNDYYRGGPAHFWEIYEKHPISGVLLQVLSEELDGGQVLCKAHLPTQQGLSLGLNRMKPYWTGSFFVIRKLHELHQYGWEHVAARFVPNRPVEGRTKIYRSPVNSEMVRFIGPRLTRKAFNRLTRRDGLLHWRIAIRADPARFWSPGKALDMTGFRWLEPPKGHFWADPFLHEHQGKTWMFFEDFLYAEDRGVISCLEILPGGKVSDARRVLERPYHLSFPFVFEHESEIYMIPETGEKKTVELYRAKQFPVEWEFQKTLFEGAIALDTILWKEQDLFWFFVTLVQPLQAGPQLFLFYADSLTGKWMYHPSNPISMDIRRARGAGSIFVENGKRIRPSQDGSLGYGYACHLNEILRLTPDEYEEHTVEAILPTWLPGLLGTHTYNRSRCVEAVDGKIRVPRSAHLG
ncbi:MAG: glucosamine inositolphosphorylceramide transferase family protein [Bryobacteraceae bacterium]